MVRKAFLRERTVSEILDLDLKRAYIPRGLVNRIFDLNPSEEALELRVQITPGRFFMNVADSREASRKCYKHGDLIALSQPQTQEEAYACPEIPLAIRTRDFSKLSRMREEEINFVGYSFYPVQGRDRRKRVAPFVWHPEGAKVYSYAENIAGRIKIQPYADSARVRREGAVIVCTVPSRTKKKPRYRVKLIHVPVAGVTERRAVAWSLKSDFEISPENRTYDIRYTWEYDREGSERFTFYPQDIAAYIAVVRDFWNRKIWTPLEMSPIALISRKLADFYKRLCNNIVIYDPKLTNRKDKLRKLHVDEKSILIARAIGVLGHDETMYWDPARDGRIKDYDWQI